MLYKALSIVKIEEDRKFLFSQSGPENQSIEQWKVADEFRSDSSDSSPKTTTKRTTVNVFTPLLAARPYKSKCQKSHLYCCRNCPSLGHSIEHFYINRSSIKRHRKHHRAKMDVLCPLVSLFIGMGTYFWHFRNIAYWLRLPVIVSCFGVWQFKVSKILIVEQV